MLKVKTLQEAYDVMESLQEEIERVGAEITDEYQLKIIVTDDSEPINNGEYVAEPEFQAGDFWGFTIRKHITNPEEF